LLKIAICDDDIRELARISDLLNQYQKNKGITLRYDVFQSSVELLEAMRRHPYQILILDIMIPGVNGIQAAQEIRDFNDETSIIFLTSSAEFAVESYSVNAYSYLLKPGTADSLYPVLDKLILKAQRKEKTLILTLPDGVTRLPFSRIEFLEVNNKKLLFHLEDGIVREMTGTLSDFEEKLLSRREFVKVHRSYIYIVNMEHINRLSAKDLSTYSNRIVPVSRLLFSQVREKYMDYLFSETPAN